MPDPDPSPRFARRAPASDEQVLAAVERAGRHRAGPSRAVAMWMILDHLSAPRRSREARNVRSRLRALHAAGLLELSRRHGVATWELTRAGIERLGRVDRALARLPESPQHRAWRNARTVAAQEIGRLRASLGERLAHATLLLDAEAPPSSDDWFELAADLQRVCRSVGAASYCLREWIEPDDARADVDEQSAPGDEQLGPPARARRRALRAGRRNVRLWDDDIRER
jgi:hypothetical protein